MGNQIFNFFVVGQNTPNFFKNKNMDLLILNLLSKLILDFGKWSNWKYANTCLRVFTFWPLPEVQNWFWKQFWNEKVHISFLKKNGVFWPTTKKLKIGFSIVISNLARKGLGFFFHARALIFSPNALYLRTKQPWGAPNIWFWLPHLSEWATIVPLSVYNRELKVEITNWW